MSISDYTNNDYFIKIDNNFNYSLLQNKIKNISEIEWFKYSEINKSQKSLYLDYDVMRYMNDKKFLIKIV